MALYGDRTNVVWLDSGINASDGFSYLGEASRVASGGTMPGSVFDFLRTELADTSIDAEAGGPGFALGWVGWLGYELRFDTLALERTRSSRYPDSALLYLDRAIEFDHGTGTVSLIALGTHWDEELGQWAQSVMATLANAPAPPELVPPTRSASGSWRYSDSEYLKMIAECQAAIAEGEAYQLCLTTEYTLDGKIDPVTTYRALRAASPAHHGALLRINGVSLLSSSPEVFLTVTPEGDIRSLPIKGTRPRGVTQQEDAALAAELIGSDKERAENLMIVDLMRNDIGRVSALGSVTVPSLLAVETYPHVHQLVSTVQGKLRADLSAVDAVEACFPAGSMTGAPKRNATVILDRLEARARGIYSGAFGYFAADGRIELAMVIRSIVIDDTGATVGSGGGITALSDPAAELDEVRLKAAVLLSVLGVER